MIFILLNVLILNRIVVLLSPVCRLKGALHEALNAYLAVLDNYTVADFIINKDELEAILFDRPL